MHAVRCLRYHRACRNGQPHHRAGSTRAEPAGFRHCTTQTQSQNLTQLISMGNMTEAELLHYGNCFIQKVTSMNSHSYRFQAHDGLGNRQEMKQINRTKWNPSVWWWTRPRSFSRCAPIPPLQIRLFKGPTILNICICFCIIYLSLHLPYEAGTQKLN